MKQITLPGSKSITNRDFILASLVDGGCEITGYLKSEDTKYMINALKVIGIGISEEDGKIIIDGGLDKFNEENKNLYVHQSGTCMRFLAGLSVLNNSGVIHLSGDKRLSQRPMWDLLDGIRQLGIRVESTGDDFPPIKIYPSEINTNKIKMNGTCSSQFFTAFLQVGALLEEGLEIEVVGELVSKPYIDMTLNELSKFGIKALNDNYKSFKIKKQQLINPGLLQVEGDASSLSYFANYVVLNEEEFEINNIGTNSKQGDFGYLEVLKKYFGLEYSSDGDTTVISCENIIKDSDTEREVDFESMPDASMSFMSLVPLLSGKTKVVGLQTLNYKECRRIDVMGEELRKLGVEIEFDDVSITISEGFNPPRQVVIETHNDHRIAMVFGVLKMYLEQNFDTQIEILNPECVSKTYPNFWEDMNELNNK